MQCYCMASSSRAIPAGKELKNEESYIAGRRVKAVVKGVIEYITKFLFTIITDKGYRYTVSKTEIYCKQVIIRRVSKC